MKDYLVKKRQGWFFRLRVPEDLREYFPSKNGKPREHIVETLSTRDKLVAKKRVHMKLSHYFSMFEKLREGTPKVNPHDIDWFEHNIYVYAESVKGRAEKPFSGLEPEEYAALILEELDKHIDIESPSIRKRIDDARKVIENPHLEPISAVVDMYAADKKLVLTQKTLDEKLARLTEFSLRVGKFKPVAHINKHDARDYVTYLSQKVSARTKRPLASKTIRDILGDISSLFVWAEGRGFVDSDPFHNMKKTISDAKRGKRKKREWAPGEIKRFLEVCREDSRVLAMFVIGLYTGMRGREIAELELENASERFLRIDEGKNSNSVREVPVHPIIKPLILFLKEQSQHEGYLIPGLSVAQPDNNRYKNIGKKIKRLREKAKIPPEVDFHSTRRSLAGALERAGVSQEMAARITGHVPNNGITYSLYSGGLTSEQLLDSISSVAYGDGVEEAVINALQEEFGLK